MEIAIFTGVVVILVVLFRISNKINNLAQMTKNIYDQTRMIDYHVDSINRLVK